MRVTAERDDAVWRFAVDDNGIGIDPQYAERIFGMFQRLHTRDSFPGTGIGLAIARKVVEHHDGSISAEPRPEGGTRLTFTLPAYREPLAAATRSQNVVVCRENYIRGGGVPVEMGTPTSRSLHAQNPCPQRGDHGRAAAAALVASAVFSSSHREAPGILTDPTADNTDVYAFTAKDAPGSLTVVANWIPLEEPAGGPYFGKLDPRARYYVKIDNTGDGREDVSYRWQFHQKFRNPNSFLYAAPTVTSANDPDVNFVQTYDLYRETYNKKGDQTGSKLIANDVVVAPDNVGPKTIPNYDPVMASAVAPVKGGGNTFVGRPTTRFSSTSGPSSTASTSTSPAGRTSVSATRAAAKTTCRATTRTRSSLQVPESQVTRDGKSVGDAKSSNAVVGVWATTERQRIQVRKHHGKRHFKHVWRQVSRLGNPLINEVIIPISQKDKFNRTSPADDLANFGTYALNPERPVCSTPCSTSASRRPTGPTSSRRCSPACRTDPDREQPGPRPTP